MSGKRSIFEEVAEGTETRPTAQPGAIDSGRKGARRGIRAWLIALFVLVFAMIIVGGLTRLTDSGLSITEWRPVTGAIPPMSEADWLSEFEKYKQIDQYQIMNQWMEMNDFKFIYWWEWGHRQLGRVVGLVWAIGFFGFLLARQIPTGWTLRLLLPGVLGGVQGAVGWWMVASGVTSGEGMIAVASYRLATHLGLAFVILGLLAWLIFGLGRSERDLMQSRRAGETGLVTLTTILAACALVQILLGALVAGIDAGRSFSDWPLIGGQILPPDANALSPWWRNYFESPGLVQFIHRCGGYLLFALGAFVWLRGRRSAHPATRFAFNAMMAAMAVQVVWGIMTVIYAAPVGIAITHQIVAVLLWVLILNARFVSRYPIQASIRGESA